MKSKSKKSHLDELDILSSVWILACNDENSIMTYQGIKFRLNLDNNYDLEKLILAHGDLFRQKVPEPRLNTWKNSMLTGGAIPSWIRAKSSVAEQQRTINELRVDDVFRSQFRAENNANRSSIEILNWGLQHLDRLREAKINKREIVFKILIPAVSLIIALSSLYMTYYTVNSNNSTQVQLKKYEVTFKIKQDNYSKFMQGLYDTFESSSKKTTTTNQVLFQNINQLEITYFNIEPFLNLAQQKDIWNDYQGFTYMCLTYNKKINNSSAKKDEYATTVSKYLDSLLDYKEKFHSKLYPILFNE